MRNLWTLKKYFLRYKSKLFWGILFILLSNIGTVYVPIIIKDAVDALSGKVSPGQLLNYAGLIVLTSIFAGVFRYFIRQTIIVVSREIEFDLRQDLWKHILKLPLRYFQNNSTGNIMAHSTNDINAVRMFVGPAVMYSVDTTIRFFIVIGIMIGLSFSVTMYALLPLPLLSYAVYKLGKKIHARFTVIQEKFSELTTKAQENFAGIRVIKSYVREENEVNDFKKLSWEYLEKNMSMVKIQAFFYPVLFLITGLSIIIVIWAGGTRVIGGTLTLGEIIALIAYLGILIWPMIAFGWIVNIIQQGEASMKRLNAMLREPYEIEDVSVTKKEIKSLKGLIEFRNVSFRYNSKNPFVLKNINLTIPVGSTLAIMGFTGSGKTTLVNLIPRLYDVTSGEVLIDGINIKEIPLALLRKSTGFVQQESFLFSDTITRNISYGLRENDLEKVKTVSAIARFDKDVLDFPKQFDTILGERGITLSGGQKQRAALARALIINPDILILDDSFSAVDTNTEEEILNSLKSYMQNRTSIIISHRISTVKDADKIIVLDEGIIKEEGKHHDLIDAGGIYADLHYKQLLEKELEEMN